MSSLFYINRQTPDALGTGLPFMLNTRYQQRFQEVTSPETGAEWYTPQNKLPCLQVWADDLLTKIELIPVTGTTDGTAFEIPIANFEQRCTNPTKYVYYTTDTQLAFTLPCGQYYFKLEFDGGTYYYYSEVFTVGGVCAFGIGLAYVITGVNIDNSVDIDFTIAHAANIGTVTYNSSVGAAVYTTKSFSDTVPVGNTNVSISVIHPYCQSFEQTYIFSNLAGVVTVNKNY